MRTKEWFLFIFRVFQRIFAGCGVKHGAIWIYEVKWLYLLFSMKISIHGYMSVKIYIYIYTFRSCLSGVTELFDNFCFDVQTRKLSLYAKLRLFSSKKYFRSHVQSFEKAFKVVQNFFVIW